MNVSEFVDSTVRTWSTSSLIMPIGLTDFVEKPNENVLRPLVGLHPWLGFCDGNGKLP